MRLTILALTLLPLPALAQTLPDMTNPPYLSEAIVQGGLLVVETVAADGYDTRQLMFNDTPVPGIVDGSVYIQAVIPAGGEDWVLVSVASGGNACPTLWAIVATSTTGARPTEVFGTCSEAILNLRHDVEGIAFEIPGAQEGDPDVTFVYDGDVLTMVQP